MSGVVLDVLLEGCLFGDEEMLDVVVGWTVFDIDIAHVGHA